MIPEEHVQEAHRRREARQIAHGTKVSPEEQAVKTQWLRRMQAQCQAIKAMPEFWEYLTFTLPQAARGDRMTTTELGLVRLGEGHVVQIIEKFARWKEEA